MVSQRQREARKRFKKANPNLFPKPEPTPPKDPSGKKKRKQKGKKVDKFKKTGRAEDGVGEGKGKSAGARSRKHPLRVPGMKPGESCFICKGMDHIAKSCPRKSEWERNKICLHCRQRGHSLKNCPEKDESKDKFCYNCGEVGHSLFKCPQPLQDGGTKFANCFICKEQGHLSKNCPKNTHGIYPKGGSCKVCGEVTHLAKDCPNKGINSAASESQKTSNNQGGSWQGKLTVFRSGDDFEDDFIVEETENKSKKSKKLESNTPAVGAEIVSNAKAKKSSGHKVVNFVG